MDSPSWHSPPSATQLDRIYVATLCQRQFLDSGRYKQVPWRRRPEQGLLYSYDWSSVRFALSSRRFRFRPDRCMDASYQLTWSHHLIVWCLIATARLHTCVKNTPLSSATVERRICKMDAGGR